MYGCYYGVLVELQHEVHALTAEDPGLAEKREQFLSVWGPEILSDLEKKASTR